MGKRILVQRRGDGGMRYRSHNKGKIAPASYPFFDPSNTTNGIVKDLLHERGRSRKIKKGPIIVCSKDLGIGDACKNLLGVDLVEAKNLNVSDLAPGTEAGRLVLWTKSSFSNLSSNLLKAVEINAS